VYSIESVKNSFRNCPHSSSLESIIIEKKLIIYGDGNTYRYFNEIVLLPLCLDVSVIIDQRYSTPHIKNGVVYTHLDDEALELYRDGALIIVCIGNPAQSKQVEQILKDKGFVDVMRFDQFYEYQKVYEYNTSAEQISQKIKMDWQDVLIASNHLSDEYSIEIYWSVIATHLNSTVQEFKDQPQNQQYLDFNLFSHSDYKHVLQLGGFDGDTFRNALRHSNIFETIMVLEPSSINFRKLYDFLHHNYANKKLQIINAAAGATRGKISFTADGGPTAKATKSHNIVSVNVWPLDRLKLKEDPTFILVDIEGAEAQAIEGMKSTLFRAKPNLAISVYHNPYDIYKITNMLAKTGLFKAFYLRNYSGSVVDTVLYCKSTHSGLM